MQPFINSTHIAACALAAALLTGCGIAGATAQQTTTHTVEHRADSAIHVETRNGSIDLRADPTISEVTIEATITAGGSTQEEADERLQRASVDISRDTSGALHIVPQFPDPANRRDGAAFVIRVPDANGVTLTSSNGRITAHGLSGPLELTTSNGRIDVQDHEGEAELTSSNGRVTVLRHVGDVTAQTSNGRIEARELNGSLRATTSNGRIHVELDPEHPGPLELRTSNGSIRAAVGSSFAGSLTANTRRGTINIDEHDAIASLTGDGNSRTLTFAQEGEVSTLRTSNGSITVEVID